MDVRYNLEFSFLFSFNFLLSGGGGGDDGNVAIISFIVGKVKMY